MLKRIVFVILFFSSAVFSQPYYYYFKYNSNYAVPGYSGDICRLNLSTGGSEIIVNNAGRVNGPIFYNSDQSRIFFQVRFSLATVDLSLPTSGTKFIVDGMNEVISIKDALETNRYYVSFLDMKDSLRTVAMDRRSLAPVDTIDEQNTAYDSFLSSDEKRLCRLLDDSTGIFFSEYSVAQKNLGTPQRCGNLGPFAGSPVQDDARSGYALVGYIDSLDMNLANESLAYVFLNQREVLCNTDQNVTYSPMRIDVRSDAFLTADVKRAIIEQVNFDSTSGTWAEYRPGNLYVFDSHAGTLLQRLKLPPEGKILLFDNYPTMLYYYLEKKQSSINIDLTKLATIKSIDHQYVLAGSGAFTLSVTGKNFTPTSKVQLNGSNRATIFVSDSVLQATVRAGDVDTAKTIYIAVRDSIAPSSHATTDSLALKIVSVPSQSLTPILDCVTQTDDTTFTAWFGYDNIDTTTFFVPVGPQNKFSPAPIDRTQPTIFTPGRKDKIFSVTFNGKNLTWKLNGNEVIASKKTARCN